MFKSFRPIYWPPKQKCGLFIDLEIIEFMSVESPCLSLMLCDDNGPVCCLWHYDHIKIRSANVSNASSSW